MVSLSRGRGGLGSWERVSEVLLVVAHGDFYEDSMAPCAPWLESRGNDVEEINK